jgi:hypothetical protein
MKKQFNLEVFIVSLVPGLFVGSLLSDNFLGNVLKFVFLDRIYFTVSIIIFAVFAVALIKSLEKLISRKKPILVWIPFIILMIVGGHIISTFILFNIHSNTSAIFFLQSFVVSLILGVVLSGVTALIFREIRTINN